MQELQLAWKLHKNLGENERFPDPQIGSDKRRYASEKIGVCLR